MGVVGVHGLGRHLLRREAIRYHRKWPFNLTDNALGKASGCGIWFRRGCASKEMRAFASAFAVEGDKPPPRVQCSREKHGKTNQRNHSSLSLTVLVRVVPRDVKLERFIVTCKISLQTLSLQPRADEVAEIHHERSVRHICRGSYYPSDFVSLKK